MSAIENAIGFVVHLDQGLASIIQSYGLWTYLILFLIIFSETGLVATPFLPGDSLIFVAGALAAGGSLNVELLFVLFASAAIIGDSVNYQIGRRAGPRIFRENSRFFKKEHLDATRRFYEKHGGKTIIIARFIPIVRTFAPFVAGIGAMTYGRFIIYNIIGGIAWVSAFLAGGYFFGAIPIVKENLSLVIIAIIVASIAPTAVKVVAGWRLRHRPTSKQITT